MKIIKVINPELGFDNIICIADSMDAAAYYLGCDTMKDFKNIVKNDGLIIQEVDLETLPENCKTLEEAIKRYC